MNDPSIKQGHMNSFDILVRKIRQLEGQIMMAEVLYFIWSWHDVKCITVT